MHDITLRPSLFYSSMGFLGGVFSPELISDVAVSPVGTLASTHSTPDWCFSEISKGPGKDFYLLQFRQGIQTQGLMALVPNFTRPLPLVVVDCQATSICELALDIPGFPDRVVVYPGQTNRKPIPVDGEFEDSDPRVCPDLVFYCEADTPTV